MTSSLHGEVDEWDDEALASMVWELRLPPTDFAALARRLEEFGGVVALEKCNARQYDPFPLQGTSAAQVARFGPLAADPARAQRFAEERTVILSRRGEWFDHVSLAAFTAFRAQGAANRPLGEVYDRPP